MLKSFIQKILILVILTTSLSTFAVEDYQIESQPQVIEAIVRIPQKGILKQKENGYLYLEVSKDFIAEALPLSMHQVKWFLREATLAKRELVRILVSCTKMNRY